VPVMEVGPPGSPNRRRTQTTAVSCRSRAGVGSDCGEGSLSAGQVSNEKTNRVEPLLTHRNVERWHRNRGLWVFPGQRRAAIENFIDGWNDRCTPFIWTKTADDILAKAHRKTTSNTRH